MGNFVCVALETVRVHSESVFSPEAPVEKPLVTIPCCFYLAASSCCFYFLLLVRDFSL